MSLKQQAITGVGWSTIAKFGEEVIRAIVMVLLARLLSPDAFGLIGMVVVFSGFVSVFKDAGFGHALIQTKNLSDIQVSSVFWITVMLGIVLTFLLVGVAPLIAAFYDNPRLHPIATLIAFNFFIQGFAVVQRSLLMRRMNFRKLAIVKISAASCGGTVAVIMAVSGFGVWSLVSRQLVTSFVLVATLWIISDWKPSFSFSRDSVRELLGFSGNLTGFNAFNYWVRKVDDLLIGKFIGSSALGIYTRAYQVMLFPLQRVSRVIGQVMFPALSKIQDDKDRIKNVYLMVISIIALITFPLMLGLLATTEHLVLAILGSQWERIIILLRFLSLVGLAQSIGTTVGWIYKTQGRTDWMFRWGVASGIVTVVAFVVGLKWGIVGITLAYTVTNVPLISLSFYISGKLINMSLREVIRSVSGVFTSAATMAIVVWILGWLIPESFSHWVYLSIQVPVGMFTYIFLIHFFKLDSYQESRDIINEQWGRIFG